MAKFIPIDKIKKLREASRSGDERAKKILAMQLGGTEDFGSLIDEYFSPQPEPVETPTEVEQVGATPNKKLAEFLNFNGITKDNPEYDSYVEDFYKENPNEPREQEQKCEEHDGCFIDTLIADEIEAIEGYNKAIMAVMNNEEYDSTQSKGLIADLEEIKRDEIEHLDKLKRIKSSIVKKEEKTEKIDNNVVEEVKKTI